MYSAPFFLRLIWQSRNGINTRPIVGLYFANNGFVFIGDAPQYLPRRSKFDAGGQNAGNSFRQKFRRESGDSILPTHTASSYPFSV